MYLEKLDISNDNLTGTLAPLGKLKSLMEVNVSNNLFTWPIPESLIKLPHSSVSSFLGNPSLCVDCSSSGSLNCFGKGYLKPCHHHSSIKIYDLHTLKIFILSSIIVFILKNNNYSIKLSILKFY